MKPRMKIEMKVTPFNKMRWKTLGDYYEKKDGTIVIETADTGNFLFNMLILEHELNEYVNTKLRGIKEPDIKSFDEKHPDDDDPGLNKDAPYRDEHAISDAFDRLTLAYHHIPYQDYDDACNEVWKTWRRK